MKNIIPLVIAVLLGLAAVFAVSQTMAKKDEQIDTKIEVVVAKNDLPEGKELTAEHFTTEKRAKDSLPARCVSKDEMNMLVGQKLLRTIKAGDYVLLSDVDMERSMGEEIGQGELGVPVTFSDTTLIKMLRPNDEIVIAGTFTIAYALKDSKDGNEKAKTIKDDVTVIVFPKVKILKITSDNSVILSLSPEDALRLTGIQQKASLFPLLRKPDGKTNADVNNGAEVNYSTRKEMEYISGLYSRQKSKGSAAGKN